MTTEHSMKLKNQVFIVKLLLNKLYFVKKNMLREETDLSPISTQPLIKHFLGST